MRGADLLVKTLSNAGVEVIFSLSGNQIMPVYDACIDAGIRIIHVRHEGAATYMAEAYAQLTGKLGVALITAAPGFASGVGPLFMATASENPILLLSGDSSVSQDGKGAFQEFDQVAVSSPMTKFSKRPMTPSDLGTDTAEAIRAAFSDRMGPTHLALAFDVLMGDAGGTPVPSGDDFAPTMTHPDDAAIADIAAAIATAERPVILVGPSQNATRSKGAIAKLADAVDAPVVPMESPRGLNDPSLGSFSAMLAKADVIVSLGKDIDFTTGFGQAPKFPADCTFYMIDPNEKNLDRAERAMGERMKLRHQANAVAATKALIAGGVGSDKHKAWREEMTTALAARPAPPANPAAMPMHPGVMSAAIQRLLDRADDPIVILDGGEVGQWAQSGITAPTRVINGPSGSIGGCLCYALAAKVARPKATVVIVMGDGTAGFHFAEFETAHRYGLDFTAIIGHDARWNAEYQIQKRDFGEDRIYETELGVVRYDLAAAGFGCHGEFVENPAEMDSALDRADKSGKPACVVARIEGLPAPSGSGH